MALLSIAGHLQPLLEQALEFGGDTGVTAGQVLYVPLQVLSPLVHSQAHSIAIFGGVLEEGSTPSRTLASVSSLTEW